MPSDLFIVRRECPACGCAQRNSPLKAACEHPSITEGMTHLYNGVGCYSPEPVKGSTYKLVECGDCDLIYQAWINGNLRPRGESCGFRHLRPSFSQLLPFCGFSSGMRGLLKAVALPFYLRSGLAARIYLQRPDSA